MLMINFEEPKLSDEEEPPTEQDKRKKLVSKTYEAHTRMRVRMQTVKSYFLTNEMFS